MVKPQSASTEMTDHRLDRTTTTLTLYLRRTQVLVTRTCNTNQGRLDIIQTAVPAHRQFIIVDGGRETRRWTGLGEGSIQLSYVGMLDFSLSPIDL